MLVSTIPSSTACAGSRAASRSPCCRCKPIKRYQSGITGKRRVPSTIGRRRTASSTVNVVTAFGFHPGAEEPRGSHARWRERKEDFRHDRATQNGDGTPPRSAQNFKENQAKVSSKTAVVEAMVAARHTGKRCARSQTRRLHVTGPEADRSLAQALGRTQLAPQGRRLSLGAFDADVLYQPGRSNAAEDATRAAEPGQGRTEAAVRQRITTVKEAVGDAPPP